MARHAHEFQCDGTVKGRPADTSSASRPDDNCGWYNYPFLDDKMTGNYTIICGHCGHKHYRVIENGVVTDDRHSIKHGEEQILHVLPSQTSSTKRQLSAIAQIRQMEAAGRHS